MERCCLESKWQKELKLKCVSVWKNTKSWIWYRDWSWITSSKIRIIMSKRMASGKFKGKLLKSDLKPRFLVKVSSVGKRCCEFWGIPTQPGGEWGHRCWHAPPALLCVPTQRPWMRSAWSLISPLSFTTVDISLTCCNIIFLQDKTNQVGHRNINPDLLTGFTRLRTRAFCCLPVLQKQLHTFCNYANSPVMIPMAPVSVNVPPPCDVSFIIHPQHSFCICCLAPCLCTTSLNIHTKSHRVKLTPLFALPPLWNTFRWK